MRRKRKSPERVLKFFLIVEPIFPGAHRSETIGVVIGYEHDDAMRIAREHGIITNDNPDARTQLATASDLDRYMADAQYLMAKLDKLLVGYRWVDLHRDTIEESL